MQVCKLNRLAKGIGARGREGNRPGPVDACGFVFGGCHSNGTCSPKDHDAALVGSQLERAVKGGGLGAVEQVEARACNGCAVGKRNLSGDTLLGMLVDEHQIGLARPLVAQCAQPGLGLGANHGLHAGVGKCVCELGGRQELDAGDRGCIQGGKALATCSVTVVALVRQLIQRVHGNTCGCGTRGKVEHGFADKLGSGHHQAAVCLAVHAKAATVCGNFNGIAPCVLKCLCRHDVKVDLRAHKLGGGMLHKVRLACPLGVRMVEKRHRGRCAPAAQQARRTVHVAHKLPKVCKLGVLAMRIEMRRAVPVGEGGHAKGMRHKPIDAAHQKMIGDPLHLA